MAEEFPRVQLPELPVSGHDLTQNDVPRGPKFALTLNELRKIWKDSKYTLSKEKLIEKIPQVLESLPENLKKKKKN